MEFCKRKEKKFGTEFHIETETGDLLGSPEMIFLVSFIFYFVA